MCGSSEGPTPEQLAVFLRHWAEGPLERMMRLDMEAALAASVRDSYRIFGLLSEAKQPLVDGCVVYPVRTIKAGFTISDN